MYLNFHFFRFHGRKEKEIDLYGFKSYTPVMFNSFWGILKKAN
jgi:hypothetical protein